MRDPYIVRRRRTGIETGYLKRITELEGQIKNMQRCGSVGIMTRKRAAAE